MTIEGHGAAIRATLCRCGHSANKPFCDGAHAAAGFTATGEPASRTSEPLASRDGPVTVTPRQDGPLVIHGNLEVSSELREREDDSYQKLIATRRRNPLYGDRRVTVGVDVNPERVQFMIEDQGPGFDIESLPDPIREDRISVPSGRGILMMRTLMDEVTFNDRGNRVVLTMWLTPPDMAEIDEARESRVADESYSTVQV